MAGPGDRYRSQRSLAKQAAPSLLGICAEDTEHEEYEEALECIERHEEDGEGQTCCQYSASTKCPCEAKEEGEADYGNDHSDCCVGLLAFGFLDGVLDEDSSDDDKNDTV